MASANAPHAAEAMALAFGPVFVPPSGFSKFMPCQTPGMRNSRLTIRVRPVV